MEKVTAFILRPAKGRKIEILIFRHPNAGLQLPAGTVEPGEAPETAVLREVEEESGLTEIRLVKKLGSEKLDLPAGSAYLKQSLRLRAEPSSAAPEVEPELGRGWLVETGEAQGKFVRVTYREEDLGGKKKRLLWQAAGWAPASALDGKLTRHFYWLQTRSSTPNEWEWPSDHGHVFKLTWVPLEPPPALVEPQRGWLKWAADIDWMDTLS